MRRATSPTTMITPILDPPHPLPTKTKKAGGLSPGPQHQPEGRPLAPGMRPRPQARLPLLPSSSRKRERAPQPPLRSSRVRSTRTDPGLSILVTPLVALLFTGPYHDLGHRGCKSRPHPQKESREVSVATRPPMRSPTLKSDPSKKRHRSGKRHPVTQELGRDTYEFAARLFGRFFLPLTSVGTPEGNPNPVKNLMLVKKSASTSLRLRKREFSRSAHA